MNLEKIKQVSFYLDGMSDDNCWKVRIARLIGLRGPPSYPCYLLCFVPSKFRRVMSIEPREVKKKRVNQLIQRDSVEEASRHGLEIVLVGFLTVRELLHGG